MSFPVTLVYPYALAGTGAILGAAFIILCIRARMRELRQLRLNGPTPTRAAGDALARKPHLYDVYLDLDCNGHGEVWSWQDIMPLSLHGIGPWPQKQNSAKDVSLDEGPLISVLSTVTVALIIAMPAPNPPPPPESWSDSYLPTENGEDQALPPPIELGVVANVEVQRGFADPRS